MHFCDEIYRSGLESKSKSKIYAPAHNGHWKLKHNYAELNWVLPNKGRWGAGHWTLAEKCSLSACHCHCHCHKTGQSGNKQQQEKSKRAKDERVKKKSEICTPVCGSVTAVLRPQISILQPPSASHHPPSSILHPSTILHLHCQMPNAVCSSVPLGACVIMHVCIDILQREKRNALLL